MERLSEESSTSLDTKTQRHSLGKGKREGERSEVQRYHYKGEVSLVIIIIIIIIITLQLSSSFVIIESRFLQKYDLLKFGCLVEVEMEDSTIEHRPVKKRKN